MTRTLAMLLVSLIGTGCVGLPENIEPVTPFDADRYLGTWYEVARLDHRFERGLSRVTATYSRRDDGGITVVNRGYSDKKARWKSISGRAYPVGDPNVGHLKVSFFRPFYASYVVFELDRDYEIAHVTSASRDVLWLLSRTPTLSDAEKARFIDSAGERGFDLSELIWVEHAPE